MHSGTAAPYDRDPVRSGADQDSGSGCSEMGARLRGRSLMWEYERGVLGVYSHSYTPQIKYCSLKSTVVSNLHPDPKLILRIG